MSVQNFIEKYCVRIKCNGNSGSGVLLANKTRFYVLTAAHCLGNTQPQVQDILIEKQSDYTSGFENISTVAMTEYNQEKDFALMEINFANEVEKFPQYKLGISLLPEHDVKFCGYQGINNSQYRPFKGKILTISDDQTSFKINLTGDTFQQSGEDGQFVARGLSGSGVFIIKHNSPFLIGILNSVLTDKAWNDDIDCCSVKHLTEYINEFIDLSDIENLKKWNENLDQQINRLEIQNFKQDHSDFFEKIYRKNKVIYDTLNEADQKTVEQIHKYLAMQKNIIDLENAYPSLYMEFKKIVSKFITHAQERSGTVKMSRDARNAKMDLEKDLRSEIERFLPGIIKMDLSSYQIIDWLGICTLNFTKDDKSRN